MSQRALREPMASGSLLDTPAPTDPTRVAVTQSRRRRGDDQVAGQGQLDPAHARRAVDRGNDRLRYRPEEQIEIADADEKLAIGLLAGEEPFGLRRVDPFAERCGPGTGDHDSEDVVVIDGPGQRGTQPVHHVPGQHVGVLGTVQGAAQHARCDRFLYESLRHYPPQPQSG
jgi:hypothetical protein